jgi:hypothetical protein
MKKILWIPLIAILAISPLQWWTYGSESEGVKGLDYILSVYVLIPLALVVLGMIIRNGEWLYGLGCLLLFPFFWLYTWKFWQTFVGSGISASDLITSTSLGGWLACLLSLLGVICGAYVHHTKKYK